MKNTFVIPGKKDAYYFHRVRPNDTLTQIIADYYGVNGSGMQPHIQAAMQDNPEITDPDRIRPGQLIVLRQSLLDAFGESVSMADCEYVKSLWEGMNRPAQEAVIKTSPWYPMIATGLASTGSTLFTLQHTLNANLPLLKEIPRKYEQYKTKKITKGQYDYFRQQKLKQYTNNIGPVIKHTIYGTQTPQQVMRIDRSKPLARSTLSMQQHMKKLTTISKVASKGTKGTILLAGVGLAVSCAEIANTKDRLKKNEIAVETFASTMVGGVGGLVAGIFLFSNPVGWTVILAIGAATAFTSVASGKVAASLYKANAGHIDLVGNLGIDKICH